MNTATLRSYLPHTVLARAVVLGVLLAACVIAIALVAALAPGLDTSSVAGADATPFRWA